MGENILGVVSKNLCVKKSEKMDSQRSMMYESSRVETVQCTRVYTIHVEVLVSA